MLLERIHPGPLVIQPLVDPSAGFDRRASAGPQLHSYVLGSPSARIDQELSGLVPEARLGGLALTIMLARRGKLVFLNSVANYRLHFCGSHTGANS